MPLDDENGQDAYLRFCPWNTLLNFGRSPGAETTPTLSTDSRFRRVLFPAFWYSYVERYRLLTFCTPGFGIADTPNRTRLNSPAALARVLRLR